MRYSWLRRCISLGTTAAVGAMWCSALANAAWNRSTDRAVRRLLSRNGDESCEQPSAFSLEQLAGVPEPVARYFQFALLLGQPLIRRAHLRQAGVMRSDAGERWYEFTAAENFSVVTRGFVWDASMRLAPLVNMRIRDSYVDGEAASEAKLAGVFSVGTQRGTPEVASASLLRYLAEAPWLPTALLPASGVDWSPVGHHTARATLRDRNTLVALDAHFGEAGEIVKITAERYRDVKGKAVLTPWTGHYSDYVRVQGMMIPMAAEVEWLMPHGWVSVWRGRIVSAFYDINDACSCNGQCTIA
ncbi:MAG: DUF6920 family protein [Vulcanimicrobiaceae bacterium]